jgi:hypothetical protein
LSGDWFLWFVPAAKMGCKAEALRRALWGDFAYQPKTKRIVRIKSADAGRAKPLFVQLALEPLWKVGRVAGWLRQTKRVAGRRATVLSCSPSGPRLLAAPAAAAPFSGQP